MGELAEAAVSYFFLTEDDASAVIGLLTISKIYRRAPISVAACAKRDPADLVDAIKMCDDGLVTALELVELAFRLNLTPYILVALKAADLVKALEAQDGLTQLHHSWSPSCPDEYFLTRNWLVAPSHKYRN